MIRFFLFFIIFPILAWAEEGIIREYYLNDKPKAEYSYKDGKLEGVCKEYYESGPLASERLFKDGKRDGFSRIYYQNGKLQFEGVYKAGKYISGVEYDEEDKPVKEKNDAVDEKTEIEERAVTDK